LSLSPLSDGSTAVEKLGDYTGEGMRVEVHLGKDAGPIDLRWAQRAILFSLNGEYYKGKTSPWWYTSRDFLELCLAAKDMTVRDLVIQFEACSGKVGTILDGFKGRQTVDLTLDEAKVLLERMREVSSPVKASRLGYFGDIEEFRYAMPNYAKAVGIFKSTSDGG
jgi:hypothetical protein